MDKISPGSGWTPASKLRSAESLVLRRFDPETGFRWQRLELAEEAAQPLPVGVHSRTVQCGTPLVAPNQSELIYGGNGGIYSYSLTDFRESHLLKIDREHEGVGHLWLSADGSIVFIKTRFEPDLSPLAQQEVLALRKSGEVRPGIGCTILKTKCSVFAQWKGNSKSDWVADLDADPAFGDVDWNGPTLYLSLSDRRLLRIALASGEVAPLPTPKHLCGVTVTRRGTVLLWDGFEERISEIHGDGNIENLDLLGAFPSLSPDGLQMALVRNSNELWIARTDGEASLVATAPPSDPKPEWPTWCPCGRHLMMLFSPSSGTPERLLIAADIEKRTVSVIKTETFHHVGGRAWIPK